MFNGYDAILEEVGPKVVGLNDFLGSDHAKEVTVAGSHVEIIEDSFSFSMREATLEEGVDAAMV